MEETRRPPDTQDKWVQSTSSMMMRARNQSSDMHTRLANYELAEAANRKATALEVERQRTKKKRAAKNRVKAHEEVINGSQACIKAIEDAVQRLEDVLSRLRHERYARFADYQVNVRRSEMRDERHPMEAFRDHLQVALERERGVLQMNRQKILDREKTISKLMHDLTEMRQGLSRDTGKRRLQVEHELASIKPGLLGSPPQVTQLPPIEGALPAEATPSPTSQVELAPTSQVERATLPGRGHAEATPSPTNQGEQSGEGESLDKSAEKANASAFIQQSIELLRGVDDFCEGAEHAIVLSRKEAKTVTIQVGKSMSKRTIDLAQVKKDLEAHIGDVNYAIGVGMRSIDKQQRRLDPRDTVKKSKLDTTVALQASLNQTLEELTEDLRGKISALDIDNACRRVTPQVASEKRRPTSGKHLSTSASAPNLLSNTETTLDSPAGRSGADGVGSLAPDLTSQ